MRLMPGELFRRFLNVFIFAILILSFLPLKTHLLWASPITSMGAVGEEMVRITVLSGNNITVVPTGIGPKGRHGLDFVYFEYTNNKGQLFINEVKTGQSQLRRSLNLNSNEISFLRSQGIAPERIPNGQYSIKQGSHAYNLIQAERLRQANLTHTNSINILQRGGTVKARDVISLADYVEGLGVNMSPADRSRLQSLAKNANTSSFNEMQNIMSKYETDIRRLHQERTALNNRFFNDVLNRNYNNQMVRLKLQNGRYILHAHELDVMGNQRLDRSGRSITRELTNVNWKNLRESGPMRAVIKDEATRQCVGNRTCINTAYRAAIRDLESGKDLHTAMRSMDSVAKPAQSTRTSTISRAASTQNSPTSPVAGSQARLQSPTPLKPSYTARPPLSVINNADNLRKAPLLAASLAPQAARAGSIGASAALKGKLLTGAKIALPFAAAIGGAYLFDMYLDKKIEGHTDRLQNYMSEEFKAMHEGLMHIDENIAHNLNVMQTNIHNELYHLGADFEYRFALAMEALERNSHGLIQLADMVEGFETRMEYAFGDLNAAIFNMATRLDHSIILTEALLNDEFHAGLKFYQVYLETDEYMHLHRAEQSFTMAQSRYQEIMLRINNEDEALRYLMLFALSGYYRTITYAELSNSNRVYVNTTFNTYSSLLSGARQADIKFLPVVMPILNYAFASIADLDEDGFAVELLMETYMDLIIYELESNRHNTANKHAMMLTLALPDNQIAFEIAEAVAYLTGKDKQTVIDIHTIDVPLYQFVDTRENPVSGSIFKLLECAEDMEEGLILSSECFLPAPDLVKAGGDFENESIRKFVIRSLLRANKIPEARHVLNKYYIEDDVFRYKSMLLIDFFLDPDALCTKANFIISNDLFADELREFAREKKQLLGARCKIQL